MKLRRSSLGLSVLLSAFVACSSPSSDVTKATSDSKAASTTDTAKVSSTAAPSPTDKRADNLAASASASASAPGAPSSAPTAGPVDPKLAEIPPNKHGVLADGVADTIVTKDGAPKVIVLEPGSEPRALVRYKLLDHKKQSVGMTMDLEMKIGAGGKVSPVKTPTMGVNMDLQTVEKDASGDMLVNAEVKGAKIVGDPGNPMMADKMMEAMNSMNGMKLSNYVSDEGRVRDMQVTMPPGANPMAAQMIDQMKQSFTSMSPPLPHEPVGVGAKWRSITRATAGADALTYTTFTLKSRTGDKIELETEIQQVAAAPDIKAPNGVTLHVSKFGSKGNGASVLDLSELAPQHATGNVILSMAASAAGQDVTVDSTVKIGFGPPVK